MGGENYRKKGGQKYFMSQWIGTESAYFLNHKKLVLHYSFRTHHLQCYHAAHFVLSPFEYPPFVHLLIV